MILVDTSIWIELLAGKPRRSIREEDLLRFVTCGPTVSDPVPLTLFVSASEIYRQGRRRGITIRSSVDCLIAAIAIDNRVPVWHRDRDFDAIARYTGLEVAPSGSI